MEFVDNTGHIFSLPSYNELPIGYEYEEYSYVFWIDANNTSKLSVNNFYSKPIYALYELNDKFNVDELDSILDIEIYFKDSNIFKLISSNDLQNAISNTKFNLTDYVNLNMFEKITDDNDSEYQETFNFVKTKLINKDLYCITTNEKKYSNDRDVIGTTINYLMIPIYPIAMSKEAGTWITNLMIHIHNNSNNTDEWCYISVGAEFVDEYEELIINGRNMGISLPKDILKSIYSESLYNDQYNEALYNQKLKEYLLNYMNIKGEIGNFKSAIDSIKWFGYGNKLTISKLLKTDNQFKEQYILDYFDISYDILESFKHFVANALVSLKIMINKETNDLYPFDNAEEKTLYGGFLGENKPKMLSLIDYYEKIKIGNHDMPIENDDEKYWYWKPYFDFSFNELGVKLVCLAYYYKQYFLPIHLSVHNASLGYQVFANDIKLTNNVGYTISYPSIVLNNKNEVIFSGNGIHYFTRQIHYIDEYFNEFKVSDFDEYINKDNNDIYEINDTCVNIPIEFISNEINNGYFNCVLLLQKAGNNETIYESHFSFCSSDDLYYKNFIIYPKKLNIILNKDGRESRFIEYWVNNDFIIKLLVNNKWYEYDFTLKIHNPQIDFGTLSYRYYLNDHNYLLSKIYSDSFNIVHNIVFCHPEDIYKMSERSIVNEYNNNFYFGDIINSYNIPEEYKCIKLSNNNNLYINWNSIDIDRLKDENGYYNIYVIYDHNINEPIYFSNAVRLENIHYLNINKSKTNNITLLIYPNNVNDPVFIDADLSIINKFIWDKLDLNKDSENPTNELYEPKSWIESFDLSCELDPDKSIYQYFKQNYNLLSPFKQLKFIDEDNKLISFNAYMHNKQLVDMNDINFDINIYDIIQYHLEHNLLYIDGTLLNNDFYQYIIYDYNNTQCEVYIHNDLIGKDIFFVPNDNKKILICANSKYILVENNDNTYSIEEINQNDSIVNLYYDESLNQYYEIKENEDNIYYSIQDKLYKNIDEINSRYITNVNLPNFMKYKNSIHLFGIYTPEIKESNILVFHNNINMFIDGLNFKHGIVKYINEDDKYYDEENLKIYVNGLLDTNIDSRYPDIYGLYWSTPFNYGDKPLLPTEITSVLDKFGFYRKRDYGRIYNNNEDIKIWELPNINEFDTKEFSYFVEDAETEIGSVVYLSLENFYKHNPVEYRLLSNYNDIEIFLQDDKFYFYDTDIKNLNNLKEQYLNELSYTIKFIKEFDNETEVIENEISVSLNNINNNEYDKIIITFYYHKVHIVRNRFYMISDYIKELSNNLSANQQLHYNITKPNDKYYCNIKIDYTSNNNTVTQYEYIIELLEFKTLYQYIDNEYMHLISNQNPSYYWYNYDNNQIESLPSYLNELERYTYNENDSIADIRHNLDAYIEKYIENKRYADDSYEARYYYSNYLVKDLTRLKGNFRLELDTNIFNENNILRLCLEIIDNDNIVTYITDNLEIKQTNEVIYVSTSDELILTGNEQQIKLYIQFVKNYNINFDENTWFIPKLIKIVETENRLQYHPEESGKDIITVKYLNREFEYGDNKNEYIYNLYKDFFKLKFNIYDTYIDNNEIKSKLLNSVYEHIDSLKIKTYLNYDFYLMHDNDYWYGLYISQETCNNIRNKDDLKLSDEDKKLYVYDSEYNHKYVLNYERSSEEYLINRLEFNSSNGLNQFKDDDIVCCYLHNNDRLPFNSSISSKWKVHPMSLGMSTDTSFDSNGEMTIISLPKNDSKYEHGYYQVTVKYSLDRDIQHQFKNTSIIRIS